MTELERNESLLKALEQVMSDIGKEQRKEYEEHKKERKNARRMNKTETNKLRDLLDNLDPDETPERPLLFKLEKLVEQTKETAKNLEDKHRRVTRFVFTTLSAVHQATQESRVFATVTQLADLTDEDKIDAFLNAEDFVNDAKWVNLTIETLADAEAVLITYNHILNPAAALPPTATTLPAPFAAPRLQTADTEKCKQL